MRPAIAIFALLVLAGGPLVAQDAPAESGLRVTRAVVATSVEDREPVGVAESFSADVGTLYFYTVFEGDFEETTLEHVWLRDGEEVARVELRARGPRWRTWSAKQIPADWTGSWTAQVVAADDQVLSSVTFTVGSGD